MIIFYYLLIIILFFVIIFFLFRTIIVVTTMLTEVPFIPSNKTFKKALEYLDIEEGNNVLDIGSGDGRVLIYASKKYPNSYFTGIEKNLFLLIYSNILKTVLFRKNLKFVWGNIHKFSIHNFDRIYMYLSATFIDNILTKKGGELKKGCKIVSFYSPMGYEFSKLNNVTKFTVKYKRENIDIFKWEKQ